MPIKQLTPDLLASCLNALIKGERNNQILYGTVVITGLAAACGLFLWFQAHHVTTNLLDVTRSVMPLVPSTVSVPQFAGCTSKIAQYRAIKMLAAISHERALRALEKILSK
jgi:hypothetical protein